MPGVNGVMMVRYNGTACRNPTRTFWPMAALVLLIGCDKPERNTPRGPGVTEAARAKTLEQVRKVEFGAKGSLLSDEQKAVVLAEVGSRKITLGEFEARLAKESPVVQAQYGTTEKRKQYLANWVHFEILAEEAARQGFDKDPVVIEAARSQMVRRFLKEVVVKQVLASNVDDDEVAKYYANNIGLYQKLEQVEIAHLLVRDKGKAEKILGELRAGSDGSAAKLNALWRDYVPRLSEDKDTAREMGSLGLVSKQPPKDASAAELSRLQKIPKSVIEAAFNLAVYTLGPLVKSEKGLHIILVTSKSPAVDKKLADVKQSIVKRIVKRSRDLERKAILERLKSSANVEINEDAIRLLPPPKRGALPRKVNLDGPHKAHGH
jgi:parvulin-like peptidyl-prolyl isomerase